MTNAAMDRACEMWKVLSAVSSTLPPVDRLREAYTAFVTQFPIPDDVTSEAVDANGVPCRWVRTPASREDRTILYLHGGGYVLGDVDEANGFQELAAAFGRAAGARVLVVNYRLAPEHPFPAAVDDSVTAYRWLLDSGSKPSTVVVAGDSAGGGLSVTTVLAARDAGLPMPAACVSISPWVDMDCTGDSMAALDAVDPVANERILKHMAAWFLNGHDPNDPLVSPIYADFEGFPPLLIQAGTLETLIDDTLRLADRAKEGGVDVTVEITEDAPHCWHFFSSFLPEGKEAVGRVADYINQYTHD